MPRRAPTTPSGVVLWIIAAAGERLTQTLGAEDNALKVLFQRRAAIVERLAGEIDERTVRPPEIEEFGATVSEDLPAVLFLSPSEALLLDLALAKQDEADAWLSYGEAQALFGERAATATHELEQAQDHHQRISGLLVALVGLALGLATWTGLLDLDWKRAVAASLAVTVASTVLAIGALLGRAGGAPEKLMEALGSLFVTAAIIAALDALNKHLAHPFISDINGLIIGAVLEHPRLRDLAGRPAALPQPTRTQSPTLGGKHSDAFGAREVLGDRRSATMACDVRRSVVPDSTHWADPWVRILGGLE